MAMSIIIKYLVTMGVLLTPTQQMPFGTDAEDQAAKPAMLRLHRISYRGTTNNDSVHNESSVAYNATLEDTTGTTSTQLQCVLYAAKVHYILYLLCTIQSVIACLTAFYMYTVIRKVRDIRMEKTHWINWNFMLSFILRDACIIALLSLYFAGVGLPNQGVFRSVPYLILYFAIANFYWMFAEGLWLYIGVIYPLEFRSYRHTKVKLSLVGWVIPAVFACLYAVTMEAIPSLQTPFAAGPFNKPYIVLILAPIYALLLINLVLMVRVLCKLSSMIHKSRTSFANALSNKWLAKATIALVFLLGVFFIIPIIVLNALIKAEKYCAQEIVHTITDAVSALQGIFVAIFYILGNEEVRKHTRRRLRRWSSSLTRDTSTMSRQTEFVALAEVPVQK